MVAGLELKCPRREAKCSGCAFQYVVGAADTIEGFWSILMRVVVGTPARLNSKKLPLHVAGLRSRYNNHENDDIFGAAISRCEREWFS